VAVRVFSNVIGFDDAPFPRSHRGDVAVVGAVYAGERFDGVLIGRVRRDGANSAERIGRLVAESKFHGHAQLVMLQGIAFGGFNVVDTRRLCHHLGLPVLVVARRPPDMAAVEAALKDRVPGGARKWRLIERLGPMEPAAGVYVQREGLTLAEAEATVTRFARFGRIPEPLRTAHLIAGALATGVSRGRV